MAYIGRSVDIGMFEKQVLTPNSSTTTFALTFAVGSANSLLVVYGGVIQEPGVAYSVSGGGQQIAFSEAPVTGTTLYIIYLGKQLTTPRAAGQETTKQSLTGDGVTTLFTLTDPPVVPAGIMVFVDGILQREGAGNNYVSGGSTINFNGAPDSGAEIDVYTLVKEKVSIDTVADGSITRAKMAATFPYWDAAGNFGIGASAPSQKLEVAGNIFVNTSGNPYLQLKTSGAGNNPYIRMTADTNYWDLQSTFSNANDALYFMYNGSPKMIIDKNGNVGIGTETPGAMFEISGSAQYNVLSVVGAATKAAYSRFNNGSNYSYFGVDDSTGSAFVNVANSTNIWNNGAFPIILSPGATEKMRVTSGGTVGIATSSPNSTSKLHVDGAAIVSSARKFTNRINGGDTTGPYNNFNITLDTAGDGEYYAKLIVTGLCGYSGNLYFTYIIEVCGYGNENRITEISRNRYGPATSPGFVISAGTMSGGVITWVVNTNGANHRFQGYAEVFGMNSGVLATTSPNR